MRTDQDFLLYPLGTEDQPHCPACGKPMTLALHEARTDRPDFSTFRCQACTRSERFVFENRGSSPPGDYAGCAGQKEKQNDQEI
jgi:transposase-like protein